MQSIASPWSSMAELTPCQPGVLAAHQVWLILCWRSSCWPPRRIGRPARQLGACLRTIRGGGRPIVLLPCMRVAVCVLVVRAGSTSMLLVRAAFAAVRLG